MFGTIKNVANFRNIMTLGDRNKMTRLEEYIPLADINRKKKQLDDIDTNREKTQDTFPSIHLTCQRELYLHHSLCTYTFEYAQLE